MPEIELTSVRPTIAAEIRDAVRLSLASPGVRGSELAVRMESFLAHLRTLSADRFCQWVACEPGAPERLLAGCTYMESSPGSAQLVVPDGLPLAVGMSAAGALIAECVRTQDSRGVRMLQCMLDPRQESGMTKVLAAHGFQRLAALCYLELSPLSRFAGPASTLTADDWTWAAYGDDLGAHFVATIAQTYVESRDCPALSGVRSAADALETHRRTGIFRPHRWLLLRCGRDTAGCILLNEVPMRAALEVVYMGVIPAYRGRRLGAALLARAVSLGRDEGFGALCLAVDAANGPARQLYAAAGFRDVLARDAWIRLASDRREGYARS